MRIGLNALYMIPGGVGGTETYARNLVRHLGKVASDDEILVFSNVEAADTWGELPSNVRVVRCATRGKNRGHRILWEQSALPLAAMRAGVDVLHSLAYTAPFVTRGANVVTLHDVNYHFHPEDWDFLGLWANRVLIPRVARRATRVLTISQSSARAIEQVLRIPADRIDVVYHGVDGNLADVEPETAAARVAGLGLTGDYLLSVTASHPHKNLSGLLAAYDRYAAAQVEPLPLVVVGLPGRDHARVLARATATDRGKVIPTGWVDETTLAALYRGARAFAFASRYEGFGFPVLEAMSVGVPVVTSNATSLHELADGAALTYDPDDVPGLAEGLRRATQDEALRAKLVRDGKARAEQFTWRRAAEQTRACYERTLATYRA